MQFDNYLAKDPICYLKKLDIKKNSTSDATSWGCTKCLDTYLAQVIICGRL